MSNPGQQSVKFKKTRTCIKYSLDKGKTWHSFYEGTEEATSYTWMMVQCGYCNDDLMDLVHPNWRAYYGYPQLTS